MRRTLMIPIRVTPAEKALIEERAGGLGVSEYLRRLGMTGTAAPTKPRSTKPAVPAATEQFGAALERHKAARRAKEALNRS